MHRKITNSAALIMQGLQNARNNVSMLPDGIEINNVGTIRISNLPANLPRVLNRNLTLLLQICGYLLYTVQANRVYLTSPDENDHYRFEGHNITVLPGDCDLLEDSLQNSSYYPIRSSHWQSPEGHYAVNLSASHEDINFMNITIFMCLVHFIDAQVIAIQESIDARREAERRENELAVQRKNLITLSSIIGSCGVTMLLCIGYLFYLMRSNSRADHPSTEAKKSLELLKKYAENIENKEGKSSSSSSSPSSSSSANSTTPNSSSPSSSASSSSNEESTAKHAYSRPKG